MTMFIVLSSWPQVIARVHSVHLMNVEQRQVAVDPQTKPRDLGCEFACRQLLSTTTISIYYYYSARKLILIYRPMEGRRLSWPRHCRKGARSPCCKSQKVVNGCNTNWLWIKVELEWHCSWITVKRQTNCPCNQRLNHYHHHCRG